MKKFILFLGVLFTMTNSLQAQHLSLNAYGGYAFDDKVDFGNAYAKFKGGFIWGLSLEGVSEHGSAIEVLYQYQSTTVPVYAKNYNGGGSDYLLNPNNNAATISYLLLNGIRYFKPHEKVDPYFGLGLGVAFAKADFTGNSTSVFAWDIKTGIKIQASEKLGIKIGAQLLSALHQSGTEYYYVNGIPYAYQSYGNIWSFGFTGGLVFNFGH